MKLLTHDGLELTAFADVVGHRPTVVFVNALGIGSEVTVGLSEALQSAGLNFLTWDRRGLPGAYDIRFRDYNLNDQICDTERLIDQFAVEPIILMSWCTGAHTALAFAKKSPERLKALILSNCPNFFGKGSSVTAGDTVGTVARILANDESRLDFLYHSLFAISGSITEHTSERTKSTRIHELVEAPFRSGPEAMLRYAYLVLSTTEPRVDAQWFADITVPTLIVGGEKDTIVAPEDSSNLAALLPRSTLRVMKDWDHYELLSNSQEAVNQALIPFLKSVQTLETLPSKPTVDPRSTECGKEYFSRRTRSTSG
jgi:pimeloyl-ACP methyl ester carboxylesterase